MTRLEIALAYASWGWNVFPLVPRAKAPITKHGFLEATTDPDKVKKWFDNEKKYNIGVACGKVSDLIIFDIDPRNGGNDTWPVWLEENGGELDGAMQLTPGGGQHYLCKYVEGIRSCKLVDGVDLLSDGRYFAVYPTEVDIKEYSKTEYVWELSSDPFDGVAPSTIPDNWIKKIKNRTKDKKTSPTSIIKVNRNSGLMSLAGAMRSFGLTEPEILAAIGVANETRCETPLPSSEIRQIAKHAGAYAIDSDVAASSAVGQSAAQSILENAKAKSKDYHFTKATAFIDQPSPIPWIIKKWLPFGNSMIYGDSMVGKTFLALDMACCIAAGINWCGYKTKQLTVGYLAGEGNYGLRQRIAAWSVKNGVKNLDNLLISNQQIAMDQGGSATRIINALSEFDNYPELIIVDTINAHMEGDENSAKDTRAMLNSCGVVSSLTDAATILIHHIGHGDGTKTRARGSSAWKGALDASIFMSGTPDHVVIKCEKMKDAARPDPMYGILEPVDLGWTDDDGEDQPGMVYRQLTEEEVATVKPKKNTNFDKSRKIFENAWFSTNSQLVGGVPFISRADLLQYLTSFEKLAERTALQRIMPGGSLIRPLITGSYISAHCGGWIVVDKGASTSMLLSRVPD